MRNDSTGNIRRVVDSESLLHPRSMRARSPSFVKVSMAPSQGRDRTDMRTESSSQNGAAGISSDSCCPSADGANALTLHGARDDFLKAGVLWLLGFKEACQIHKAVSYCQRSRPVFTKTGQCFLLNGCLFLGSILVLQRVVVPVLGWFLGSPLQIPSVGREGDQKTVGVLQTIIVGLYHVFWLYPIYIISFGVNIIWYNDIAKHAFQVMNPVAAVSKGAAGENLVPNGGKRATVSAKGRVVKSSNDGLQSTVMQIGEKIYSVIMVSVFFMEVFVVSYVPYVGPLLNFVLLSWLYAYYCFDYRWGFEGWSLERRLHFFETNWAFFAGFGCPAVLATFFLSPLVSAGVMNILFPLFVLVATASKPEEIVRKSRSWLNSTTAGSRLPIFYFANNLTVPLLALLEPAVSTTPSSIKSRQMRK